VFTFNGETITLVDVHNTSRGGSDALFGQHQPRLNAGDDRRADQTSLHQDLRRGHGGADPHASVMVMGDFNAFQFETSVTQLESGGAVTNLTNLLAGERALFVQLRRQQPADRPHAGLAGAVREGAVRLVHINSQQAPVEPDLRPRRLGGPVLQSTRAPVALGDSFGTNEDTALVVDAEHGVLANDMDKNNDALVAVLQAGPAHGTLSLAANGSFTYTPRGQLQRARQFHLRAKDTSGAVSEVRTVTLQSPP
jgi:hypothetical protein